jgi:hypothetical protein
MKLIKLASLALAAAGIFGVCNAGAASIGVTTNSTPLNVAITVITNTPSKTSGNTTTWSITTTKITNKLLLTLFQNWASVSNNAFSVTGAKIVIGWDQQWDGDVLVVDKTGTNVLFDASAANQNFFYVVFDDEDGAFTEKDVNTNPGSFTYTDFDGAYYELYDNNVVLPFTDLYGYGAGKITYTQRFDKNGKDSGWNLSTTGMFPLYGNQTFNNSNTGSASANINSNGGGKTFNNFWD